MANSLPPSHITTIPEHISYCNHDLHAQPHYYTLICFISVNMRSYSSTHTLLVMAVFLVGTSWGASGTRSSPLKVANDLKQQGALTVLNPPGCCSKCGPDDPPPVCPQVCTQCRDVVVEERQLGRLDTHTPYPLPYMMIQVKDVVWCVDPGDLKLLKQSVTLAVGPGACGPYNRGLEAFAFVLHNEKPSRHTMRLCLYVCNRD